jgi:hypothetical protein
MNSQITCPNLYCKHTYDPASVMESSPSLEGYQATVWCPRCDHETDLEMEMIVSWKIIE